MLDFYQIFKLSIFENFNDNLLSTTGTRLNRLHFLLSQAQGATDANDNLTINPIKKLFQIRGLILQIDFTTYSKLKNNSASLNFLKIIQLDSFNLIQNFIGLLSDENKSTRYAIDLNVNNVQAIRDLGEEIRDLKRKLVEDREERDNKRSKNNSDKPKPIPPIPSLEDNNRPNNNNENNRPNDNNDNNNTPTPTTTSNTPTTTILSNSTTSIPTTRTKSTTTFTFLDIPFYTTIDDTSTTTTTTTATTTILSKT
ncbi:hypothetical protein F8M41_005824 [Gigaspora margarita]|uniref:Uncharacterized protein n=1 Tax=Gigaspora margarita TaxID=4874 RepID=A0A8H3X7J1_GIGMA|nr:hypothetical protein F8M41_005824 [Gigaspora margarita]